MNVEDVTRFWMGPLDEDGLAAEDFSRRWYQKSDDFDASIRERFKGLYESLAEGSSPPGWDDSAVANVARIIVLDQFSRNMFRGSGQMYASDSLALRLARALTPDLPQLATHHASFALMPLMHAEDLGAQDECVSGFEELSNQESRSERARAVLANNLKFAHSHREVISRFGRFPHRNALLGRESTPEEAEYLQDPKAGW